MTYDQQVSQALLHRFYRATNQDNKGPYSIDRDMVNDVVRLLEKFVKEEKEVKIKQLTNLTVI